VDGIRPFANTRKPRRESGRRNEIGVSDEVGRFVVDVFGTSAPPQCLLLALHPPVACLGSLDRSVKRADLPIGMRSLGPGRGTRYCRHRPAVFLFVVAKLSSRSEVVGERRLSSSAGSHV
jgi:hypothetical protein